VTSVGGGIAIIRPGAAVSPQESTVLTPQVYNTSTLNQSDADVISAIAPDIAVAPIMRIEATLKSGDSSVVNGAVIATSPDLPETTPLPIADGQFIDSSTSRQTAVIGQQMSIDLFGTDNSIGKTFTIRDERFTVIGILENIKDPVNYNNIDFNRAVIVDLDTGKTLHRGNTQIQQINIKASSPEKLNVAIKAIDAKLAQAHNERDFHIIVGDDVAEPTSAIFTLVARTMTAIAAISLVVGGIGVMNIMLVSVAERTREIGIRKSVGASNNNIIAQFLVESVLVSVIGGIIGITAGVVLAFAIGTNMFVTPMFSWQIAAVAFGFSLAIGIIFGLYPALRASRKDPIDSLRQYR
jgi:putative ABC transport system permease protein